MVEKLKASGVTIIYIASDGGNFQADRSYHRVEGWSENATLNTRDTNLDALVKLMVGRELKKPTLSERIAFLMRFCWMSRI